MSAASVRSLPPNRLGHVLMLWYRTDVLAALARGNDTRGGGGASGNGTPAAAGTNAAAANGTAGGPQRGAGVDEDAAAAAEAAVAARAVPATWQALLQLVAALNGTDWDGDGRVKYGICLNRDPGGAVESASLIWVVGRAWLCCIMLRCTAQGAHARVVPERGAKRATWTLTHALRAAAIHLVAACPAESTAFTHLILHPIHPCTAQCATRRTWSTPSRPP